MGKPDEKPQRGCRYFLKLAGFGLGAFVVLGFIAYNVVWVLNMTAPGSSDLCCQTPADTGHSYEDVSFSGGDGLTMRGWWITPEDDIANGAAVILIHGYAGDRVQMLNRADMLVRAGYGVLAYDLRAHGQSEGPYRTFGWADVRDVPGALEFVQAQPGIESPYVGVLGFSIGGQIALRAAARHPEIASVVAEEPGFVRVSDIPTSVLPAGEKFLAFLYWLDLPGITLRTGEPMPPGIVDDLPGIGQRPVLYLSAGPADEYAHVQISHFAALTSNSAVWNVPESVHGSIPRDRPSEYEERITGFFDMALSDEVR